MNTEPKRGKHERKRRRLRDLFTDGSIARLKKLPSIVTRTPAAKERA